MCLTLLCILTAYEIQNTATDMSLGILNAEAWLNSTVRVEHESESQLIISKS